jgi:hypothetical protein
MTELFSDPAEPTRTSGGHTMVVETRTSLKVRRCRLVVQTGPSAGRELVSENERIRIGGRPRPVVR